MFHLDGSYGEEEAAGRLCRTSLSLSALLGEPVAISDLRAGHAKPGLRPQHFTRCRPWPAWPLQEVDHLGSRELTFRPRAIQGGDYFFDVGEKTGSAGSVTLVAQALLPPPVGRWEPSHPHHIRGGTHVAWSPPAHYLRDVFLPALAELGAEVSIDPGPAGAGILGGVGKCASPLSGQRGSPPASGSPPRTPATFKALSAASRYHAT